MLHSPHRALHVESTTIPAAGESLVVLDSTRRLSRGSQASLATSSTFLTPGPFRNAWAGAIVRYTVRCTTQNVTALDQILTGTAGTSADFETQGAAGTHTVTAGTTAVIEFKPLAADWRIKVDAAATPGSCIIEASVLWGEDYGS